MIRNRGRGSRAGGRGGGNPIGAGLLGEGPGASSGMRMMMSGSGGGEGGLLGKAPNQGRMNKPGNQGRMPQRQNQGHHDQLIAPPRPPRSLLDTPGEEQHSYGVMEGSRDRDNYRDDGHFRNEGDYYEEPHRDRGGGYREDDRFEQGFDDHRNLYDDRQGRDSYALNEPDMDYGRGPAPNSGRSQMNPGRNKPLLDRAPVDDPAKRRSRWSSPTGHDDSLDHQSRRELMEKASNQVRMQQSPRSLLETPGAGGHRDQRGPRNNRDGYGQQQRDDRGHYDEPRQRGGLLDDDSFDPRFDQDNHNSVSGRKPVSPRSERRSRFDEPRSQLVNPPKSKQRDLMEKAEMQMKLLEEEKRLQQVNRERLLLQQQQQALLLQQQQMQLQQQKMQLMHQQQAGLLGSMPAAMMGNPPNPQGQGSMGSIPSLFDVPCANKTNLGKRPSVMSRNQDIKKPRRGLGESRFGRSRTLSGNRDRKPLNSRDRKDQRRSLGTNRTSTSNLRSKTTVSSSTRHDRKNSTGSGRSSSSNDKNARSSTGNRGRRDNRDVKSKPKTDTAAKETATKTAVTKGAATKATVTKGTETKEDKSKVGSGKADANKDKKDEQYDPAEPTGEVVTQKTGKDDTENDQKVKEEKDEAKKMQVDAKSDVDKKDTEISLTVTVNKKGRSVNDSDKKEDSPVKTKKYKCNVCAVDCYDEESFARHMNGVKHKQKMEVVMTSTSQQAELIKSRLQAEEHLRQIEAQKGTDKGKALETHCKVCDKKFTGAYKDHKESKDHKEKEDRSKAGCKICNVASFNTYHDFTSHLKSNWHKKKETQESWPKCKLCNQKFKSPRKFVQHCKTDNHIQNRLKLNKDDNEDELSELVTLDTVGFEEDTTTESDQKVKTSEDSKSKEFRKPLPVTSTPTKPLSRSTSLELDEVIPDKYDPTLIIGQKFIVPVAGYFCKICSKFYNNETAAKVTHCQSKSHYERLLRNMEAKKAKAMEQTNGTTNDNKNQSASGSQDKVKEKDNEPGTKEEQNNDDLNDSTVMELGDKDSEDNADVTMETDDKSETSECNDTIEIEFTEKPVAKSSPKGRQQKARRGGVRGRGARRN